MDHYVIDEAKILARDYSNLRVNKKKWLVSHTVQTMQDSIVFQQDSPQSVHISRNLNEVEVYLVKSLYKRAQIRRNSTLFRNILQLWNKINPFNLTGISEKVYKTLYSILYSKIIKDAFEQVQIVDMVKVDMAIDFCGKKFLTFMEFYDGLFEFIDCNTRSKLLSEYCHMANQLIAFCDDSGWSDGLNLYSKLHIHGKASAYSQWMLDILKRDKVKNRVIPKMLRTSADFMVSPRLLSQKKFKPIDRENFNIRKLEKIMSEKFLKRRFKPETLKSPSTNKRLKIKTHDRKAMTFYSNYIEKISPISSMRSMPRSKKSNILECVISGRKNIKMQETLEFF